MGSRLSLAWGYSLSEFNYVLDSDAQIATFHPLHVHYVV